MADDETRTRPLWFLRREGRVTGPFPSGAIRRFVVLGRVGLEHEVSNDRRHWQLIRNLPEVIPPEIRRAMEAGDPEGLLPERLREDERTGLERRRSNRELPGATPRRSGDRRQEEPELLKKHRLAKTELRASRQRRRFPLLPTLALIVLFGIAIGYGFYLGRPSMVEEPDCTAKPAPGVNWRNCRLDGLVAESSDLQRARIGNAMLRGARLSGSRFNGADLQYADLGNADLSYAEFRDARMKGVGLSGSDLTSADLTGADLSYANLQGARLGGTILDGARLDNAIWSDGRTCRPGSVGVCLE
ncbi:MAG TPA: pentapeptide repeat-containing protein [Sedimenticola thiotaurini]|uniref:Pentapeptide repeat-containing protein n=1 Tax=Sedimenticola thiotaurini TaxID=1543721 RepID=A0A831RL36_9GAMM|nr:pentapeptide repeat-containing protein [Sedimenticola thiotaurini]